MSMLKVSCPHCGTPTRIDSARLPDRPLRLPCPSCQGELVLDKARLLAAQPPDAAAPPTPTRTPARPAVPAPERPPAPSPVPALGPKPTSAPVAPARQSVPSGASGQGSPGLLPPNFSIPEGTRLPAGIMVGDDVAAMAALSEALQAWGSSLEVLGGAEIVRRLDYVPELQVIVVDQAGSPPSAVVAPFADLPARSRRRTFIVLVASDVTTLDGNQAFLHEVDLVLGRSDLDRAAEILYAAMEHHERLYAPFFAEEEAGTGGVG